MIEFNTFSVTCSIMSDCGRWGFWFLVLGFLVNGVVHFMGDINNKRCAILQKVKNVLILLLFSRLSHSTVF